MHVQTEDLPSKVRQKHNIAQREVIRQAYEYANYRLRTSDLEVIVDQYVRFGAYEQCVTNYCNGILQGIITI